MVVGDGGAFGEGVDFIEDVGEVVFGGFAAVGEGGFLESEEGVGVAGGVEGVGDAVGVEEEAVAGEKLNGAGMEGFGEGDAKGVEGFTFEIFDGIFADEDGGRVSGGGIGEGGAWLARGVAEVVGVGFEDGVEGGDEIAVVVGVVLGEFFVEEGEEFFRGHGVGGVGMGDGVGDGHEDGGGGSVAGDVGEEDAGLVVGEREEVVIIATGAAGGLVMDGDFNVFEVGEFAREEGALDVSDDFKFAVHFVVGDLEALLVDEVEGGAAPEVGHPDHHGELFKGEAVGGVIEEEAGVDGFALVEMGE